MKIKNIVKRHLSEAKADTGDANVLETMDAAIWEIGYPDLYTVFGRNIQVDKGITSFTVPYPGTLSPNTMSSGDFGVGFVGMTYVTISVNQIKGLRVGWTREYAEDVKWDVMAPQLSEIGRSIEEDIFEYLLTQLTASAGTFALTSSLTYGDILEGCSSLAVNDYDCDIIVMNPVNYYELLNDEKFINASYIDSAEPIRTGVINVTIGAKIVSSNLVTAGEVFFLDSDKALALVTRRDRSTEEYSNPEDNEYGIVASVRYGASVILSDAIRKGTMAA